VILLTPGPLTTRRQTREAMLQDWGSRDPAFIELTAELRRRLTGLVHGEQSHTAVPLQGSGTFAVEAAINTLVGVEEKLLVLANGVYGERIAQIAGRLGRRVETLRWQECAPVDPARVRQALQLDPAISHVALVHCETTTGLINPLEAVAGVVAESQRHLILDAMSSFGAITIDLRQVSIAALLASANKCLEGTPGIAFAIVERQLLARSKGKSSSLSLDLYEQWRGFEANGQWRFTPPVQVVAAAVEALRILEQEGGPEARHRRYQDNMATLLAGMQRLGFAPYLDSRLQSPIIATFRIPEGWPWTFEAFYAALAARGYLIYPGKLTHVDTFRIGCIGAVEKSDFAQLLAAIEEILSRKT
jgi:2-aminoethylphosphonate-pyruvate transaminase